MNQQTWSASKNNQGLPNENWFFRHWNGNLSLVRSFWINSILGSILFGLTIQAIWPLIIFITDHLYFNRQIGWDSQSSNDSYERFTLASFDLILTLSFAVWAITGVYRASQKVIQRRGKKWPVLALIFSILLNGAAVAASSQSLINEIRPLLGMNDASHLVRRPNLKEIPAKPVIYLYPERQTNVTVQLNYKGTLTASYPSYDEKIKGWHVKAYPDGHLVNAADNKTYSYLFWEGASYPLSIDMSSGFVVEGKDTAAFLQDILAKMGLTPQEYNEFVVYWLPKMQGNKYNFIHFAGDDYTQTAPLDITPKPESLLRVFMMYKPLTEAMTVPAQEIHPFIRKGFTVIEWGGTEIYSR